MSTFGGVACEGLARISQFAAKVFVLICSDVVYYGVRGCLPALLDGRAAAKVIGVEDTAAAFIRGGDAVQCVETNPKSALMSVTNKGG